MSVWLVSLPLGGRVCYDFPESLGALSQGDDSSIIQAGGVPWGAYDFTNHSSRCLKQNANHAKHVLPVLPTPPQPGSAAHWRAACGVPRSES